jgi:hypothetical protein
MILFLLLILLIIIIILVLVLLLIFQHHLHHDFVQNSQIVFYVFKCNSVVVLIYAPC